MGCKKLGQERPYRFTNLEKLFKDLGELGKGKELKIIVGMTGTCCFNVLSKRRWRIKSFCV